MRFKDIDDETLIRLEISFYKILQRHKDVRKELWSRYGDVCDIVDDINKHENKAYEFLSEDAQLVLHLLLSRFATDAGSNEELSDFFYDASEEVKEDLERKIENRVFYDILLEEELDEDDERILRTVKDLCKYCSKSTTKIVQLIILEIDRIVRDSTTYVGSYDLKFSIREFICTYNEKVSGYKVLFKEYEIYMQVLRCIHYLYHYNKMPTLLKITNPRTEARLFDIRI